MYVRMGLPWVTFTQAVQYFVFMVFDFAEQVDAREPPPRWAVERIWFQFGFGAFKAALSRRSVISAFWQQKSRAPSEERARHCCAFVTNAFRRDWSERRRFEDAAVEG